MIGIDSNILIYAHNNVSRYYNEANRLIHTVVEKDLLGVSEISLREFYAVITDGRKVDKPLTPENASILVKTYFQSKRVVVCQLTNEAWEKAFEYLVRYRISRYDLDDLLIALTLWLNGVGTVYTRNIKDFKKFDFIEAINPFSPSAMPSAPRDTSMIPYARQSIDEKDVAAVCQVLRSDWLTTGPKVQEFEQAVAEYVGAKYAVAVSSGTAALHCAMFALGIGPGDEVIVPPMTFVATANCVVFQGGTPIFADVDPHTLLIDPDQVENKITPKTKAIIAVDYAGQPCEYDKLRDIAERHGLKLLADGCHALGAEYKGKKVGSITDMTAFSFHPVKHITTGEGGIITTDDAELADRMRLFRTHGITRDQSKFVNQPSAISHQLGYPPFYYEMQHLGYNYRMTDFQCALGISQLKKLQEFLQRRHEIAAFYDEALANIPGIEPLGLRSDVVPSHKAINLSTHQLNSLTAISTHAYHLYVVQVGRKTPEADQGTIFNALRKEGIGVNVHYLPVYLHPFYQARFGPGRGQCPTAENAYERILSLPISPGLEDRHLNRVIASLHNILKSHS